jgi:hypothetical protein
MTNRPYIAYSLASATWLATGASIDEARAKARHVLTRHGGSEDHAEDFLLIFDAGSDAEHITHELEAHRLQHNLKGRPVVWRGVHAQAAFGGAQGSQ